MNANTRSILSNATGFGLAAITITSAFVTGVAASATLYAFGLLVTHALINILVLSYAPSRPAIRSTPRPLPVSVRPIRVRTTVRVPAVVEYPECPARVEAA